MRGAQKKIIGSGLGPEDDELKKLRKIFEDAKAECERKINELSTRRDWQNLQSIIYQKQYQEAIKKQIDEAIANIDTMEYTSVNDYIRRCYENGYVGAIYDLQSQGVPMALPIDQKQVVKAMRLDTKLSSRLYKGNPLKGTVAEDITWLKAEIASQVARGVANGDTWGDIALRISQGMNNPFDVSYRRAVRIVRTEGHRVQQTAMLDAQRNAKEHGAEVKKQWDSTLDDRTRPTHQELDGQVRELEEEYESPSGLKAMCPGQFGDPAEDCNCRCVSLTKASWALDSGVMKRDSFTKELLSFDSPESYEDFKDDYFSDENIGYMKFVRAMEEKYDTKNFNKVLGDMSDDEYDEYTELLKNNPLYNKK